MSVTRIVPNIAAAKMDRARAFYGDMLGMTAGMDHGGIVTLVGCGHAVAQISVAGEGGAGTPVPELSIEVDGLDAAHARPVAAGHDIECDPAHELWGVYRAFVCDSFGRPPNILSHDPR